jgi:hypothetical protein
MVIDEDEEMMKHVIDRFTPDELCEIMDINTKDFCDKFYDEILDDPRVREALGYESED